MHGVANTFTAVKAGFAVVGEEADFGLGLLLADVLQAFDTDIGDRQQDAVSPSDHVGAGAAFSGLNHRASGLADFIICGGPNRFALA